MSRLPLILCAIALLSSLLSIGLFFRIGNSKQILAQRLTDAETRASKLDGALAHAHEENGALQAKASGLGETLASTRGTLAAAQARTTQLNQELAGTQRDLSDTRRVLALYEDTVRALGEEVGALQQDLASIQSSHAPPETILAYKQTIGELERQLATARNGAAVTGTAGASTAVFTSRAGRATVLNVGPQNAFVVLNFGSARGAALGQKLTIAQGTAVIATVLISDVRANFSIAQVLPDTLRGVLQKGDSALLIR